MKALVIIGLSGAGKTSAGKYLSELTGIMHFEASTYMKRLWNNSSHDAPNLQEFAQASLSKSPELVPNLIIHDCMRWGLKNAIITGFRSPAEVDKIEYSFEVRRLVIETAAPRRLARFQFRNRAEDAKSLDRLAVIDGEQLGMGLINLIENSGNVVLANDGSVHAFQSQLANIASNFFGADLGQNRLPLNPYTSKDAIAGGIVT